MELRQLRYFVAVAEHENLRRAASLLNIAAPAISIQIAKLEAELGFSLFTREKRSLQLTQAGRVFHAQARKVLAEARRGVDLARQAAGGEFGELSIGHNVPAGFLVFPKVIPQFRAAWPDIRLSFRSLNNQLQLEALRNGEIDIGFAWLPLATEGLAVATLLKEPLVAVIPAEHPLARREEIAISDFSGEPLIMSYPSLDPDAYHRIEQLFLEVGATMNPVCQLDSSLSMINFVSMGIGCSLLPAYARRIHEEGVVYRPIQPPTLIRELAMVMVRDRNTLAGTFFDFAVEQMGKESGTDNRLDKTADNPLKISVPN